MTQALANQGRYGDSVMVHMNPAEVEGMGILSGQPLTVNPTTGAYEAFNWGQTLGGIAGGAIAGPWGAGIGAGLGSKFIDGQSWGDSLTAGLTSGIMSWGMGSLMGSDMMAGMPGADMMKGTVGEAITPGFAIHPGAAGMLTGTVAQTAGAGLAGVMAPDQQQQNLLPTGAYGGTGNPDHQNEQFRTPRVQNTQAQIAAQTGGGEKEYFARQAATDPRYSGVNATRQAAQGGIVQGYAGGGAIRGFYTGGGEDFGSGVTAATDAEQAEADTQAAQAEAAAAVEATVAAGLGQTGPAGSFAPGQNTAQSIGNAISAVGSPVGALTSAGLNAAFGPAEGFAESLGRGAISTGVGKGVSALTGVSNPMGMGLGILGNAISAYGDMTAAETAQDTLSTTDAITDMEGYDAGRGVQADPNDPNIGLGHIGLGIANAFGGRGHDAMAADALSEAQQAAVAAHNAEQEPSPVEVSAFNMANPSQDQGFVGMLGDQHQYGLDITAAINSPDGAPADPAEDNMGPVTADQMAVPGLTGWGDPDDVQAAMDAGNAYGADMAQADEDAAEDEAEQSAANLGNLSFDEDEDPEQAEQDDQNAAAAEAAAAEAEAAAAATAEANAAAEAVAAAMGDPSQDDMSFNDFGTTFGGNMGGDMDGDPGDSDGGVDAGDDGGDDGNAAQGGLVRAFNTGQQGATVGKGADELTLAAVDVIQNQRGDEQAQRIMKTLIQRDGKEAVDNLIRRVMSDQNAEQRQAGGINSEELKQMAMAGGPEGPAAIPRAQPEQQMAQMVDPRQGYAVGGQIRGFYGENPTRQVDGPGDGLSDSVSANIEGKEPVNLASGEVIVPADVVSDAGNGDSDAGADFFAQLNENIRMQRHGTKKQPDAIDPAAQVPALPGGGGIMAGRAA